MNNQPINFLTEHRKPLSDLYFNAVAEKQAITKKLSLSKNPNEDILKEYTLIDNLIKSLARVVYP